MNSVHGVGAIPSALVPFITPVRALPVDNPPLPADYDMLGAIGRTLDIVPSAGLDDPNIDPVALAIPNPPLASSLDVVVASNDPAVPASSWNAFDPATGLPTISVTRAFAQPDL
jgi:hypothetical protein